MEKSIKQFIRTVSSDKFLTITKVLGLGVGFLVFVLAMLFVQRQLSFDSIHDKKDRIYRVNLLATFEEVAGSELGMSHYKMEPLLRADYPEIEEVVRLFDTNPGYADYEGERAFFDRAVFVDSIFFKVFDFELVHGQADRVFQGPSPVVISEELSRVLFGNEDPIGQLLSMSYGHWVVQGAPGNPKSVVTGVFKKEPNSHLQFDVLTSFSSYHQLDNVNWSGPVANTYVLLKQGASPNELNKKLEGFYAKHHPSLKDMYQPSLQPLGSIHLDSAHIKSDNMNWQKFDRKYISIFIVLALIVLIIAAVNFVQLSIGQLFNRLKSTAVRKLVGATEWDIVRQYYFETAILCIASVLFAVVAMALVAPALQNSLGFEFSMAEIFEYGTPWIVLVTILVVIAVVGFVPALISQFVPTLKVLTGRYVSNSKSVLPKILILTQIALSFGLLAGGIIVYNQTNFLLTNNEAFDRELILQVPLSEEAKKAYEQIKQDMLQVLGVGDVTAASNQFGTIGGLDLKLKVDGVEKVLIMPTLMVDPEFLDFYGITVKEGKDFGEWGPNEFIVNQAWVDNFGWEEPIGQQLGFAYGKPGKVVGVVDNFNYNSLHEEVEPFCFWSTNYLRVISIKVNTSDTQTLFNKLEDVWQRHAKDMPFTYSFLDDDIEKMYKAEVTTNQIVKYLTIVAVLLSSLGIYALSFLIGKRKTREVSIRKVLGAPANKLFAVYSAQFYKIMLIGFLIISPIVYLIMNDWLSNFAYKDSLPVDMLTTGFIAMILVSTLALTFNLVKLVLVNPVVSLREK